MPRRSTSGPAYKEITFQQFRSFCETVRLGSFSAAASSLGLSHPTIWNQVHALERRFNTKLVETHARGCRATTAGAILAELAAPLVTGFSSLEQRFQQAVLRVATTLVIAATARILVEDLPDCVVEFERRRPQVQLTLKELRSDEVITAVSSGAANFGFASSNDPHPGDAWLEYTPCYELDVVLLTPKSHPLARRKVVKPRDLCAYPLVNAPSSFVDPSVMRALEKLGGFNTQLRRVEAYHAATIRRYVAMGFGIGLIGRVPSHRPHPDLHERSMSADFGRTTVYLVHRKGALLPPHALEFAETVKHLLNRKPSERPAQARRG
jgi:molybdate transport repressor ModE-like protein